MPGPVFVRFALWCRSLKRLLRCARMGSRSSWNRRPRRVRAADPRRGSRGADQPARQRGGTWRDKKVKKDKKYKKKDKKSRVVFVRRFPGRPWRPRNDARPLLSSLATER